MTMITTRSAQGSWRCGGTASPSPPVAAAAGMVPTASTPADPASLTSFCPRMVKKLEHGFGQSYAPALPKPTVSLSVISFAQFLAVCSEVKVW
jgi:hypothetical protein